LNNSLWAPCQSIHLFNPMFCLWNQWTHSMKCCILAALNVILWISFRFISVKSNPYFAWSSDLIYQLSEKLLRLMNSDINYLCLTEVTFEWNSHPEPRSKKTKKTILSSVCNTEGRYLIFRQVSVWNMKECDILWGKYIYLLQRKLPTHFQKWF
jgi:hypothetical protein